MNQKIAVMGLALITLVSVLTVTVIITTRESRLSEATIFVSPSSVSVNVSQHFEVGINLSEVVDLYGWEFKLGWNTSLFEAVNVTESSFLKTGADTYIVSKLSNTEGRVLAGCTRLRNVTGANGNGTLAIIEFRAKKEGTCTLDLYDTKLVDSQRQLMIHSTIDGVAFIPDTTPPSIAVLSPQNKTYYSNQIPLTFEINEPTSWIGYSLNNQANVTTTGNTIINVEDGSHNIMVYTNDTAGNMDSSATVHFTVDSTLYEPWKTSFIGLGGYPIVDFAVYNTKLYAAADNMLYVYDGNSWNIVNAPTFVVSLVAFQDKLVVGGQGGLYSFDGTSFTLAFQVPTCIKVLGVYNNTLYAGTILDKPPTLYYCNASIDNPADWHVDTGFSSILNFSGPFGSIDSFGAYSNIMYLTCGNKVYSFNGTIWSLARTYDDVYAFLDMQVYNGRLYLATRDQAWRKPFYQGGTGFGGRVIEFDGSNWTTKLDNDYWIYSLETYHGILYAGTANKMYEYNMSDWETTFNSIKPAQYAISFEIYDDNLYTGMGNGHIYEYYDPVSLVIVYVEPSPALYIVWIENGLGDTVAGPNLSDGTGDFTAFLENGVYMAFAQPPIGDLKPQGFTVPETTCVTIDFRYEVTIHVQYSDGTPVYPADVKIYDPEFNEIAGPQSTNETGDTIFCLEDGIYKALAFDSAGNMGQSDFCVPDNTTVTIIVGIEVTIQVQYSNGDPVVPSIVKTWNSDGDLVSEGEVDVNGIYKVLLGNGDYLARAWKSDGDWKDAYFTVPNKTCVEIIFESNCVTVTVLHDGQPVEAALVWVDNYVLTGTTNSNGKVNLGCGVLDPETIHSVYAIKGDFSGYTVFTTNSAGGAEVTVEIS